MFVPRLASLLVVGRYSDVMLVNYTGKSSVQNVVQLRIERALGVLVHPRSRRKLARRSGRSGQVSCNVQ